MVSALPRARADDPGTARPLSRTAGGRAPRRTAEPDARTDPRIRPASRAARPFLLRRARRGIQSVRGVPHVAHRRSRPQWRGRAQRRGNRAGPRGGSRQGGPPAARVSHGAVRPLYVRRPHPAESHGHGADEPQSRGVRGPRRARGHLLLAACQCGSDRERSEPGERAGCGLRSHARHPLRRTGHRVEIDHRRRAPCGRPDLPAAVACRPRLAPGVSARRAARRALRHSDRGSSAHAGRPETRGHAARARARGNPGHR